MIRKSRLLSAVAAAAALAAAVLLPASPAAASPVCDEGYHCGWDIGFDSGKVAFFNSDPDFRDNRFDTGAIVDNNIKSAKNRTSTNYVSYYYSEINYTGRMLFCVNPGSGIDNLQDDGVAGNGRGLANEASSMLLRPVYFDRNCF
jgi:hypothetical protein